MASLHSIRAVGTGIVAVAMALPGGAFAQDAATAGQASYTVIVRGAAIGSERITLTHGAEGWTVASEGQTGAPLDILARRVQVRYTEDWKPIDLNLDATVRGQVLSLQTFVTGTTAQTHLFRAGQGTDSTDTIAADSVLLVNGFWGTFEALAHRVRAAAAGAAIPAYSAPIAFEIRVAGSADERIQTTGGLLQTRRTHVAMVMPGNLLEGDIWTNEAGRLLRLSIPAQNIEVVREDIASVAARRVTITRANDEPAKIPANGFSLIGTISKPAGATTQKLPAVVLVGGSGPADRDETTFNIPIFGQLADALADAGYLVLRYDKRGVGQSGGRAEAAVLADYAEDLRAVAKYVSERKDVDSKRLAVLGHGDGGSVAMMAAAKDKRVAALVLVATNGVTGAELNLEQVAHALDHRKAPDAERRSTLDLQIRIQGAVLTGKGWEQIPLSYRKPADTPWFQSFLAFDPANVMRDVRQPILIVQGMLDTQVMPKNADRLEALARGRKNAAPVEVARVPGVNHLLVPATTGEYDEYSALADAKVSPAVSGAVVSWLQKTFPAPGK